MTINIHQTLHGYDNGHQLLASSLDLDLSDHKLLLFQSDLSGPSLVQGFESYISGFPLKTANFYAFSRTWYADEMKRPGCVWTHTILIPYADLGRVMSLESIKTFFRRPEIEKYQDYRKQVEIDTSESSSPHKLDVSLKEKIATMLYEAPQNSVIIPAMNSRVLEDVLIDIWSDQWPRLRRNFLFSSGCLSLRTIDKKLFDAQVVPSSLINQIKKQSEFLSIVDEGTRVNPLIATVKPRSNKHLTGLTWLIGSDVDGRRENYLRLLEVVSLLSKSNSLDSVAELMSKLFPNPSDALIFKSRLFGRSTNRTFHVTEYELLQYLLFTTDKKVSFIDLKTLDLEDRMKELLRQDQITVMQFAELWSRARAGRISDSIWSDIELSAENALLLSTAYPELSTILLTRYPSIATSVAFWQIPTRYQLEAIRSIADHIRAADGIRYTTALISAKSEVIVPALRHVGEESLPTFLFGYVESKNDDPVYLQPFLNEYYNQFRLWLRRDQPTLHDKLIEAMFVSLSYEKLQRLEISTNAWLYFYNSITSKNTRVNKIFAACIVLSIGFENRMANSDQLVIETFSTVYRFGLQGQLGSGIWQMINRDDYHYQDEQESVGFWSMFTRKKKDPVPSWDYCDSLVRIGAHAFVKNNWSAHSFVSAFRELTIFERVIDYLLTYQKGQRYLEYLLTHAAKGKLSLSRGQEQILRNAPEG